MNKREAKITIKRKKILREVDAFTYKRGEASMGDTANKSVNELESDSDDTFDNSVLNRLINKRDAELRKKIRFAMPVATETDLNVVLEASDEDENTDEIIYNLLVPEYYTSETLKTLAMHIHDYLVTGVLSEWYAMMHVETTYVPAETERLLLMIASMLRVSSMQRPLSPFAPAKKYKL